MAQTVKNLPVVQETLVGYWVEKILWRREWQATPVFLPGEFHEQRRLVNYSPWGSWRPEQGTVQDSTGDIRVFIILELSLAATWEQGREVE